LVSVQTRSIAGADGTVGSGGPDGLAAAQASAVFAEKVDSTLGGRPFELARVTAAVDSYLNPSGQAGMKSAERDVMEFEQREKRQGNAAGEKAIC
jgi:hypothetical protein